MFVITKKDILFYLLTLLCFSCVLAMPLHLKENATTQTVSENLSNSNDLKNEIKIIIDAGHGEPDGGAVSENGVKESELNLQIAQKLKSKLEEIENVIVIMTRDDENNIATETGEEMTIKQLKTSDLNNRVKIANESGAQIMVSIHMNKFENSKYRGWQTFYSKTSDEGKKLAEYIQSSIGEIIDIENKRVALKIEGIKIIDKTQIPTVIVECGFLSNIEECKLLQDETYQEKMAEGIKIGIQKYLF